MELVDLGKQFQLGSLAFATVGHRGGPTPVGVCGSLLRQVEEWHVRHHFENVKIPKGAHAGKGPIRDARMQMWADLCGSIL